MSLPADSLSPTLVAPTTDDAPVNLEAPPLEALDRAARYELGATLGRGGMGEVRHCRDVVLNRGLAMKLATAGSAAAQARFVREARVQGQLEHPAIVPVHDLGLRPDGQPYFTMKRVRGVTLEEVLRGLAAGDEAVLAKFPRRRLLTAFQSVCLAVDFAHARRVIHRDLKPANVMLGDFGEVYVLDWGLAKRLEGVPSGELPALDTTAPGLPAPGQTAAGAVMGTPGYMAPEQVMGEPADERADVFALGSLLFELLTLQRLVPGDDVPAIMRRTLDGFDAQARLRAPRRDIAPELEALCVRATARLPADRYRSARALHDALDDFLSGERDVELRAELARRHVAAAEAAAAREERSAALRELGQALALDATNPTALRSLVRLLGDSRGEVPPGARAELDRVASQQTRTAGRLGAVAYLSIFLYLPLLWWMGIRDLAQLALVYGLVLASAAASWSVSLRRAPTPTMAFIPFAVSTVLIAGLSLVLGPFVFLPSFAATNAIAFAVLVERRHRAQAVALGALGVVLPLAAELLGWVPNPLHFSAAGLTIAPQVVELSPGPTMVMLSLSAVGTIVIATLAVARLRDALREAEQRLVVQAWHLRQLLPPEATAATTGEHPMALVSPSGASR